MTFIQHHYGHILSCIAEHKITSPVLGIAWDGTSYGTNNSIWGGEFLRITRDKANEGFDRVAHFLPYYLPGKETTCSLEPRSVALGLLYGCYGEAAFDMTDLAPIQAFTQPQQAMIRKMLTHKINMPVTSNVGQLFDGIASLLNLHHYVSFQKQAALTLEFVATQSPTKLTYPFTIMETQPSLIDWQPMIQTIVCDCRNAVMASVIAAKFHNTLVAIILAIAQRAGHPQVVMAGDCFQNTVLIERAIRQLSAAGFTPYWPQRVPLSHLASNLPMIFDSLDR